MAQLQRALFRSFLRWNRRKYILEGRFRINPADFKCHELFPPSTIIQDAPGVQAAIYHAFRNTKASPNAINESVRILRELNEFALQVKETYEKRNLNSNEQTLAFAKFRVGQVVQKKESKVRAVVIGWKVNFTRKTQTVQILSDFDDTKKHTKFDIPIRPEFVTASELELVEDPMMMRIFHFDTDKYFIAFDEKYRRYIPNADLLYLYPRDFDTLYNPEVDSSTYSYGVSDVDKAFLEKIDHLVRYQGEQIHALSSQFFPWRQLPSTNATATATPGKDDSDLMNCRIITDEILGEAWWRLSHIRQSEGSILPPTSRQTNNHTDNNGANGTSYIPAGINLSYVEGFNQSLLYSDVPSHCLLPGKRLLLTGTKKADFERAKHIYQQQLHALHEPWNHIRNIYHRFGHFNEFLTLLEQILQLRFQSRGIGFHTSLYTTFGPLTRKKESFHGWQMHRHEFHPSVQQFLTNTQPLYPTIFQVGQVVRHKLYGFRGIITGYDQRPLSDASKRADLLANGNAIPRGKEQPFYRLLIDERDIALFRDDEQGHAHGQLTFDHSYLPEDCLEAVQATSEHAQHLLIVSHPDIARFFLGWNQATQRFRPRHQLKYAFPAEDHCIPVDYPAVPHHPILHVLDEQDKQKQDGNQQKTITTTAKAAVHDSETSGAPLEVVDAALYQSLARAIVREEVKIYENIDLFLVTLNGQMNTFLGNVVARHIDRLRRVQQEQASAAVAAVAAAVSGTHQDTLSSSSLSSENHRHCVPNTRIDDTPIGKPTVTSRMRVKQQQLQQQLQQQQWSGHTSSSFSSPGGVATTTLEIADIHRLLQLAPLRFASLDVDLFLHKTLPSPPPGHRHNHDLQVLVRIAATHAIRGNYAETLHAMEHAILLEPLFFEAYFKQALAWSRLGDSHAMIKLSLQTLALSPTHLGAHYLLALAYANTKRKDQAVELMKQGLRLNPWAFNLASDLKTLLQE